MSAANPLWGAPKIHGELLKLGIEVSQATVSRYMPRQKTRPSQSWRAFLDNHVRDIASIDFFTVPTATFRVLFVFLVLSHDRRRIVHFNVTANPTPAWTGRQIIEAFPWDTAPKYLLRDRDCIYGEEFRNAVKNTGAEELQSAPRSPWQNPFVERIFGSIRRECTDHVIVLNECHLRRVLSEYFDQKGSVTAQMSLEDGQVSRSLDHYTGPARTNRCRLLVSGSELDAVPGVTDRYSSSMRCCTLAAHSLANAESCSAKSSSALRYTLMASSDSPARDKQAPKLT